MPLPSKGTKKNNEEKHSFLPSLDSIENEEIEDISSQDLEDMYTSEDEESKETIVEKQTNQQEIINDINEENPFYTDEDYDFKEKPKKIDKEKKKVIPIGGTKSVRRVDPSDFDSRNDAAKKARIAQLVALSAIVILLLFGFKNTFFPSNSYNPEQIEQMAKNALNDTGFPKTRGETLVEDFTSELLSTDSTDEGREERLKKYMTSEDNPEGAIFDFFDVEGQSRQKIVQQPKVYDVRLINKNVGIYKVTAVVSDDTGDIVDQSSSYSADLTHRVTLQMNVFYDDQNDSLSIIKRTVALIPNPSVGSDMAIKKENMPLGSGLQEEDTEVVSALQPIVYGYLTEFLDSSRYNNDGIKQYIPSDAGIELYDGFNGDVIFNGSPSEAISFTPYKGENEGEWKVFITMSLRDANSSNDTIVYNSTYVMTINQIGDVKLVTRFMPYNYLYDPAFPDAQ
jgi:hypothetical protein